MLVLELLYAAIDLGEPLGRFGVVAAPLNVTQSARAFDVGSATRAIKFELPQIVIDHRFNQFVPGQHTLAGRP